MTQIVKEISDAEKAIFRKKIKKMALYRGSGTELISLYLPPDTDRSSVSAQLTEEMSQSSNIKDQRTRKNVQGALKRIINFLKQIDFGIPSSGMVIFSGNISRTEGKTDIKLFTINPIRKLETKRYWCDSEFHLDPLEEMAEPSELYGIVTIDKNEATIAMLKGKKYEIIGNFKSRVAGKSRAGGQSAHRFEHLREEAAHNFYKEISEHINNTFLPHEEKLKGLIIAGPGITKNFFLNEDLIDHRIKKKLLGKVDTSYTEETGIREALNKSNDLLKNAGVMREKKVMQEFFKLVVKDGLAAYGEKEVDEALSMGKVETLLLSEDIEKIVFIYQNSDGKKIVHIVDSEKEEKHRHPENSELIEEIEYIDYFLEKANHMGSKTEIISADTEEGNQFLNGFGGIGAILRFK